MDLKQYFQRKSAEKLAKKAQEDDLKTQKKTEPKSKPKGGKSQSPAPPKKQLKKIQRAPKQKSTKNQSKTTAKTKSKTKKAQEVNENQEKENQSQNQEQNEQIKEEKKLDSKSTAAVIDITQFSSIPINQKPVLPSSPIESYVSLDLSSPSYNPSSSSPFKKGQDIPFAFLCTALQSIEKISGAASRKKMILILSHIFWTIFTHKPGQVVGALYFLLVKLCPDFVILETGCGQDVLTKVMCKACSVNNSELKKHISKMGDYGNVISSHYNSMNNIGTFFKNASPSKPSDYNKKKILTLKEVFRYLYRIAMFSGKDSKTEKYNLILQLLQLSGGGIMAKYIMRYLGKNLKVKIQERGVIQALSRGFALFHLDLTKIKRSESKVNGLSLKVEKTINSAITQHPSYDGLIKALLEFGGDRLDEIQEKLTFQAGMPVSPMLAKPTKAIQEVLSRFDGKRFTCQYKYDGFRGQIHYFIKPQPTVPQDDDDDDGQEIKVSQNVKTNSGQFRVFSRNLNDLTQSYPDIEQIIKESINQEEFKISDNLKQSILKYKGDKFFDQFQGENVTNFILDCEIVAFDRVNRNMLPFSQIQSRSRGKVELQDLKVDICLFPFDLIYLNGVSLIEQEFHMRRAILHSTFQEKKGHIEFANFADAQNFQDIQEFFNQAIRDGTEGLMVKSLYKDSQYLLGKRSFNWLKLKKDYIKGGSGSGGLADSIDLVPVGALMGTGKRAGQYGSFLLASYNPQMERFQTVCKIGTGFSEDYLQKLYDELSKTSLKQPSEILQIGTGAKAENFDVWFEPSVVWEVKGADLQISPVYTNAQELTKEGKGVGLRFPRFERQRKDKDVKDCTSAQQIFEMFENQAIYNLDDDDNDDD